MIDPDDTVTPDLPQAKRIRYASNDRYYSAALIEDLFDQWMVIQSRGGRHNMHGGGMTTHVDSFKMD